MPNTQGDFSRVAEIRECKDCQSSFEITEQDAIYYETNGWSRPSRCPECRQRRRASGQNIRR